MLKKTFQVTRIPYGDFHVGISFHYFGLHYWKNDKIAERSISVNVMLGFWMVYLGVHSECKNPLAKRPAPDTLTRSNR